MKRKVLLSAVLVILSSILFAQIRSTGNGGYWNDKNTWVGGFIPGSGNDVIIDGPVILASASGYTILTEYCHNLTVSAAGSLKNGDYGGGSGIYPLEVTGDVINNGTVANGPTDALKILISGNFENNNIWMPYQTEFQSADNHNLSLAVGKTIGSKIVNNAASTITALTDLIFTCDFIGEGIPNVENFYLNGKTLVLGNHSIELRKCLVNSGTLTGDFHIKGNFKVDMNPSDTMVFIGNITVDDTLTCNQYNGGYAIEKLKIIGNLTNNGTITDNDGDNPDDFSLLISGNVINNGLWTCNFVNLIGTGKQYITQSAGKQFDSFFADLNPASKVQALSDISITKDFNLKGSTLEMDGHTLSVNGWLYNGFINNTVLHNGYLQNITSLDNLHVEGLVTVETGNIFQKSVVVNDTLQSKEYGGGSIVYNLVIDGNIQNNGVIRNISDDDQLSLEIWGDIENNGQWLQGFTKFSGFRAHHLNTLAGHVLNGQFSVLDSIGSITALSDVIFSGDFNLGKMTMDMQNKAITFPIDRWLYNGCLKDARLGNAMLSKMRLLGNTEINGLVKLAEGNDAIGNITVNDTLTVIAYGGGTAAYTFVVYGNVTNRGLIGQVSDDLLSIKISGNINNEGVWSAWQNHLLFYSNTPVCSLSITNKGNTDLQVNGSSITGLGAGAFTVLSGGGAQTVAPDQSYSATIQYTPAGVDATALLTLDCGQVGSLNSIQLHGFNYQNLLVATPSLVSVPGKHVLNQNFPNPFSQITRIRWQSPVSGRQIIRVCNVVGNQIAILADGYYPAGNNEVEFDASELPSGVYFYQLKSDGICETKKMLLIR